MHQFDTQPRGNSANFRAKQRQKRFIKRLKLNATPQEIMLHGALLTAFAPYRVSVLFQEPIGPYVADFFLYPMNIVIEVDGGIHTLAQVAARDKRRDTYMQNKGIRVLRFTNEEIAPDPPAIARRIVEMCAELPRRGDPVAVTKCPPGSAVHGKSRFKKNTRIHRAP
jgi:very-short-patch-repair endonuclease